MQIRITKARALAALFVPAGVGLGNLTHLFAPSG
jgi:hypothetical protein